ncbi:MAG TPA: HAD-IB family hydrolase [Acidimicrobiales bacterium]|jgi:putative phosphoserine phosphatase/1-acylglycerol-3-phosphate O-acyltransferase|nr:HAD-IB family hydrolase [Acidimicrobiales bacterium]
MAAGAAFFDLDRTLLSGGSGLVLSEAMRTAGVVPRALPGERLLYNVFSMFGENLPSMALARQAATLSRGRSRAAVQQAAEQAAEVLSGMVQPYAEWVFEEHREAGRPLVLATTTPYDLVWPLAQRLGLDDVVATRYGERPDGTYDGSLAGPFVWANGKLAAVREWAAAHGIDLAESWAYSDSFYDTPLLSAVGHPVVVNPDPRMVLVALARRWPTIHLDVPPGVPKLPVLGVEPQQVAMQLSRPLFFPYARFDIRGEDRIPQEGGAVVVANHRSYFDAAAIGMLIARTGRTVRFLGKKEVFDAPIVGQIAKAMGGIRVDRGTGSDEPLRHAAEALEMGQLVAVMPQGTIPRGPAFFSPKLKGRWGAARLAGMARVPVIPVGLWGTERVWPRSSRLPHVWNVTDPPTVRIRVGKPVDLKYRSADADTKRIMTAISALLPAEARRLHNPTPDELARTYPPGYHGDPEAEEDRRPGTD